ncbi:hypothetical protein BXZ70DRAFT_911503 [Cristinia sonorae]|uniref:Ribonuclease H1 N-terminal domain-containing protein n=1 Tax=Cristinia sonorae TaxID=1940300 RepID=A0A8K0UDL0_9AGAR|nr:hypothetical protein BXZ70DRAFT_911503 [Cristinia sonorae]
MILDSKNIVDRAINVIQTASRAVSTQNELSDDAKTMLTLLSSLLASNTLVSTLRQGGDLVGHSESMDPDALPPIYEEATRPGPSGSGSYSLSGSSVSSESTLNSMISPPGSPDAPFRYTTNGSASNYTASSASSSPPTTPTSAGPSSVAPVVHASGKDKRLRWYAIFVGTEVGVVQGYDEAFSRVDRVSGFDWKGFKSKEAAEKAFNEARENGQVKQVVKN